jgi:hypothetical protein
LEEAKFPNDEFGFDPSILTYLEDGNVSIDHCTASRDLELESPSSGSDFASPVAIDAANAREDGVNLALEEFFKDSTAFASEFNWGNMDFDCLEASLMEHDAIEVEQVESRVASPEVSSQQDLNPAPEPGKLSFLLK